MRLLFFAVRVNWAPRRDVPGTLAALRVGRRQQVDDDEDLLPDNPLGCYTGATTNGRSLVAWLCCNPIEPRVGVSSQLRPR